MKIDKEKESDSSNKMNDILNIFNGDKKSTVYIILVAAISLYGGNVLKDLDDKKAEIDNKLIALDQKINEDLKSIQDRSVGMMALHSQSEQRVMEIFRYTTSFTTEQIGMVKQNIKNAEDELVNANKDLDVLSDEVEEFKNSVAFSSKNIENLAKNINELKVRFDQVNTSINLKDLGRETDVLLDSINNYFLLVEQERLRASKVLVALPNVSKDRILTPLSRCVVLQDQLEVVSQPNSIEAAQLSRLPKDSYVDLISDNDSNWSEIRYFTVVGYADKDQLDCTI